MQNLLKDKMSMTNKEIMRVVQEIRQSPFGDTKRVFFQRKYPDFIHQYPKLFEAALRKDFPLTYLAFMLEEKEKLENKEQNVDDADAKVYAKLREKYVDPLIANTSTTQPLAAPTHSQSF